MTIRPRQQALRTAAVAAALLGLAAAGCGSGNPSPPSSAPAGAAVGTPDTAAAAAAARRQAGQRRPSAFSADPDARLVDQVAAVVGDSAILFSEIRTQIFRMQSQGTIDQVPQDPAARDSLARSVLDQMIDDMIILQAAQRSGTTVPDARLEQAVDRQFQQIRNQFPSQAAFRRAVERTGMNMYQYRQNMRQDIRARLIRTTYVQQEQVNLPPIAVTEEEIRQRFEQRYANARRPARVTLQRVLVRPQPDSAAADSARRVARKALEEIRDGTPFAVAVRRYTDDDATREQGGDLGWLQRGDVTDAFADAAWRASPGRPGGPVRTPLGYHVIEIQNVRGGERNIRHILVRPEITDEDVAEARELASALTDSVRRGADPERLAETYGERGDVDKATEQQVPVDEIGNRLGSSYAGAIGSNPEEGSVVGPVEVSVSGDRTGFAVVKVTDYRPAGRPELDEVREQVRQEVRRQKQFEALLERLRGEVYVEIKL